MRGSRNQAETGYRDRHHRTFVYSRQKEADKLVHRGCSKRTSARPLKQNRSGTGPCKEGLQLQVMLSMALNRRARRDQESLAGDVARHQRLLTIIEAGDPEAVLVGLTEHGDRTFLDGIETKVDGHTEVALQWLRRQRDTHGEKQEDK